MNIPEDIKLYGFSLDQLALGAKSPRSAHVLRREAKSVFKRLLVQRLHYLIRSRFYSRADGGNSEHRKKFWQNIEWDFNYLQNGLTPLLGHTIHRLMRNMHRYPNFYFHFDQYKALQAWNYWNHTGVALPYNAVLPKGEIGINPANPYLRSRVFSTRLWRENGHTYLTKEKELTLSIEPRLAELNLLLMRKNKAMRKKEIRSVRNDILALQRFAERLLKDKSLQLAFKITLLQLCKDTKAALSFWSRHGRPSGSKHPSGNYDKLQIGGGKRFLKGFVNLDLFPPADVIWDCRYGLPFPEGKFEFVFSEHFLEHLDFPASAKKVLSEIHRVMKPGGTLILGVPDAGKAIRAYCKKDKRFLDRLRRRYLRRRPPIEVFGELDLINYLFRDQLENPNYTVHYWAYDADSLSELLRSVGFRSAAQCGFDRRYCNPERKFYTLYVKAVK